MSTALGLLTLALWGECRGQPAPVCRAIAHTTLNIAADAPRPAGQRLAYVLRRPGVIQGANRRTSASLRAAIAAQDPEVARLRAIAAAALAGERDPTRGARHFHTRAAPPRWARGMRLTAVVGKVRFYREIESDG